MLLEFLGAAHEVTGSCHFLQCQDKRILVDCGMEQGPDLYVNQEIPVNASNIDYVFVTHAHIDHSGLLPLLYSHGFRGQIFATTATSELCNIMLKDSAHIQMFEAEWRTRKARRAGLPEVVPLYDMDDAQGVLEHFVSCDYNKIIEICNGVKIRFVDAGHLLGSSSIEVWLTEEDKTVKIVFSGDIGHGNKPLIKNPQFIDEADYVLIESTYGDRIHADPPDYAPELAAVIKRTFARGEGDIFELDIAGQLAVFRALIAAVFRKDVVVGIAHHILDPLHIGAHFLQRLSRRNERRCGGSKDLAVQERL